MRTRSGDVSHRCSASQALLGKCQVHEAYRLCPQHPELKGTLFHMLAEGLVQCEANAAPLNACPSSFAGLGEAPGQRWEGLLAS